MEARACEACDDDAEEWACEEGRPLLKSTGAKLGSYTSGLQESTLGKSALKAIEARRQHDGDVIARTISRSLDVFKGVLVIFMTFAHVDLALMSPVLQFYSAVPHFIGNFAAGQCFLGFMLAYGFSCDRAYLSNAKRRSAAEQMQRVARSVLLPVVAAWICSFAWAYICFKFPMDLKTTVALLSFRMAVGNGPDFLLCFPICLLAMFMLRPLLNRELDHSCATRRWLAVALLLVGPLALTRIVVLDCTGVRKYVNYFFECYARELWSPNLPALPHLFYFNLGLLLSRCAGACTSRWASGLPAQWTVVGGIVAVVVTVVLAACTQPLLSVWAMNYGNLQAATKWGPVSRGFSGGPTPLWLLGNLFFLEALLVGCFSLQYAVERVKVPFLGPSLRSVLAEVEHLGANVLLYLVVADICLAGLYRGAQGQFPLDLSGGFAMTIGLLLVTRFLFFLSSTSRSVGGDAPQAEVPGQAVASAPVPSK
mmetsp:Transcript_86462/g.242064  ORF Transcript_86462/g.242064 Transcript_86462/m.242064 type:complete len:481 (-) Transcript_86462:21-1463(-)